MHIDKDLTAAPATPLVLSILSEGDSYGYVILKRMRELSEGKLEWAEGMLYPVLHRLRRLGYVTAEWRAASEGHRRRYYSLTPSGRRAHAERRRKGTTETRPSGGVWGGPLLSSDAGRVRVRRWARPGPCLPLVDVLTGAGMGASR